MIDYYNDNAAISKSGLDKIDISPLDYWWKYLRPEREPYTPDKQTLFDNALRCAVFEPKKFASKYVKIPNLNKSTTIGKSEFASLTRAAEQNAQLLLTSSEYDSIIAMQAAILKHITARELCTNGRVGIPDRFEEKNTGAPIKFKPHFICSHGMVVNLTSTKDASLSNFQKEAGNFRHDKKAVIQMEGTGCDGMAFISVEAEAPYKIGIRYLDDRSILLGRETVVRNCETYLNCLDSGLWPGFDTKIVPASLPTWYFKN